MKKLAVMLFMLVLVFSVSAAFADVTDDVKKGGKLLNQGKYNQAIACLTVAIDSNKLGCEDLAIAHFYRGLSWMKKGCCMQAYYDYSWALDEVPHYGVVYYYRSQALECLCYKKAAQKDMAIFEKFKKKYGLGKGWGNNLKPGEKPCYDCVPCYNCAPPFYGINCMVVRP